MDWLTASTWSPYAAGAGIGVLSWLTLLVSGHPIGCSTSFARTAGMIEKLFRGGKGEEKLFYREIPPVVDWQWMLVAGMVFALASGQTPAEAFRFGIAAGSAAVGRKVPR